MHGFEDQVSAIKERNSERMNFRTKPGIKRAIQAQSARSCDFGHVEEQRLNMAIYQARSCPPIS